MRPTRRPRVRTPAAVCGALVAGLLGTGLTAAAAVGEEQSGPATTTTSGSYVVTLTGEPAAAYDGGVPGLRATAPSVGRRFDRTRPAVAAYRRYLIARQDKVLAAVGGPDVLYRFTSALNGFAARLDPGQVVALRRTPGVALVERSTRQQLDAVPASALPGGPVAADASVAPTSGAGKGVVVGVVDSGIWPDSQSFSALPQEATGTSTAVPGFNGECAAAERWSATDCNDKVISARWFVEGFGRDRTASSEYLSARDATGHGTHAASVAAGNPGVETRIEGQSFGRLSGLAPEAKIAVYKACWTAPDPSGDGCTTADTVAAIDAAVGDGVDVLSYSVSGSRDPTDSVSRAFLGAASAGVFVAAAAGNDGPRSGSVGHQAPWVTTVGADTRRLYRGVAVLGDGTRLEGAMVSTRRIASTGLVLARDAAALGARPRGAALCEADTLDAEVVAGKVVLCRRGVTARVDKSAAVARAGGVGMVLVNTAAGSTDADVHAVPTVHLARGPGRRVVEYAERAGGRARVSLVPQGPTRLDRPVVAEFSSRGPTSSGGSILKPDLTAPGVSVLGAVTPGADSGRLWDLASGTSTSTPYVAGLAATVRAAHPGWSASRVRSALMTTTSPVASSGTMAGGAGAANSATADDPGIVFDTTTSAWRRLLAGRLAPSELNQPSVAVGELIGRTTVVRRVTNVTSRTETYSSQVSGLRGVEVVVSPARFTLAPGQTRRIMLLLAARSADRLDRFAQGTLTLSGVRHTARVPIAVRPRTVAAPEEVAGSGDAGGTVVRGRSGTSAPVQVRSSGLVPADVTDVALRPGPFDTLTPRADADTLGRVLRVPAGSDVLRVQLDPTSAPRSLDLYVYRGGTLVDSATAADADRTVTLTAPAPGDYTVYVHAGATDFATASGVLYSWVVGDGEGRRLRVPTSVRSAPGDRFSYRARWRGLDPDRRWLAVVRYGDSEDATLLQVD